jgi:Ferric reductase like transmembrane component
MTLLDLCSYLGLCAVGAVTVNLLLGMLMSLRYSPMRHWPHRRINLFALHQWTAYLAVFLTLSHPAVLLFLRTPHFGWTDVLWPIHSYLQPKLNLAGAGALYLIVLVLVSSLLRAQIARPLWRSLHYLVFPCAALLFLHSILTDPNLKGRTSRSSGRRQSLRRNFGYDQPDGDNDPRSLPWKRISLQVNAVLGLMRLRCIATIGKMRLRRT